MAKTANTAKAAKAAKTTKTTKSAKAPKAAKAGKGESPAKKKVVKTQKIIVNALAAQARGKEKMEQVAENSEDFMDKAIAEFNKLKTWDGTGEDLRNYLTEKGAIPHHPNAWGALVATLIKRGALEDTGKMRKMQSVSSHGRKTSVYERVPGVYA